MDVAIISGAIALTLYFMVLKPKPTQKPKKKKHHVESYNAKFKSEGLPSQFTELT